MSGGGGLEWDPKKDLENLQKDPVGTIANAVVNIGTMGTVGFEDGQFNPGANVRAVDETIGSLTGRNIARKQAMQTQDLIAEQKVAAQKERATRVQQQEQTERQASMRSASVTSRTGTGTAGNVEQQMALDFLGL